jgi:MYXO-CTERM domain-containing protein
MFLMTLIAGFAGAATAGGLTIVLDDFDSDPNDEAGGPRAVSSIILSNPFNQPATFEVNTAFSFDGINGAAVFNSGIGVEQEGTILWDNNGAGLGLDAASLGLVGFELDFLMIDQDFTYIVEVSSASGALSTFGSFTAGGARTESLSLGDFDVFGAFDASAVDSVRITFNVSDDPTASLDFILTEFRAVVPTPGSLALLGLGGLLAARRRR